MRVLLCRLLLMTMRIRGTSLLEVGWVLWIFMGLMCIRFDMIVLTPTYRFPTGWQTNHMGFSPSTPFTIMEFEGGSGDGWGGVGEDRCAILVNNEGVRVIFKNNYSFGVTIFNTYMIYGGTNWGNLGHHGGYASYDYRASITEDRQIWREKYNKINYKQTSSKYLQHT